MRKTAFIIALVVSVSVLTGLAWGASDVDFQKAVDHYKAGRYEEAVRVLEQYVQERPEGPAYYLLGYANYALGKHDVAARNFKDAYLVDPEFQPGEFRRAIGIDEAAPPPPKPRPIAEEARPAPAVEEPPVAEQAPTPAVEQPAEAPPPVVEKPVEEAPAPPVAEQPAEEAPAAEAPPARKAAPPPPQAKPAGLMAKLPQWWWMAAIALGAVLIALLAVLIIRKRRARAAALAGGLGLPEIPEGMPELPEVPGMEEAEQPTPFEEETPFEAPPEKETEAEESLFEEAPPEEEVPFEEISEEIPEEEIPEEEIPEEEISKEEFEDLLAEAEEIPEEFLEKEIPEEEPEEIPEEFLEEEISEEEPEEQPTAEEAEPEEEEEVEEEEKREEKKEGAEEELTPPEEFPPPEEEQPPFERGPLHGETFESPFEGAEPWEFPEEEPLEYEALEEEAGVLPPEAAGAGLMGMGELFGRTWGLYKKRLLTLVVILLLSGVIYTMAYGMFLGAGYLLGMLMEPLRKGLVAGGAVAGIIAGIIAWCWGYGALVSGVADERLGVVQAYKQAWQKVGSFVWIVVLLFLIIIPGGFLLLVIPGILFTVWFSFGPFIVAKEDVRGMSAVIKSKEYVRGHFGGVFLRLVVVWVIAVAVYMVQWKFAASAPSMPFLSWAVITALSLVFTPFIMLYTCLIYHDLRGLKGDVAYSASGGQKAKWLGLGILGWILGPILFVLLTGAAILGSLFMLKAQF